jgi:hypothetical protein
MMSDHPSKFRLEKWWTGKSCPEIESHVDSCEECRDYVESMKRERLALLQNESAQEFMFRAGLHTEFEAQDESSEAPEAKHIVWWISAPAALVAIALISLMFINPPTPTIPPPAAQGKVAFKGHAKLAVILLRDGKQSLQSGKLTVAGGDKIQIQLELTKPSQVTVGVLQDDGSWNAVAVKIQLAAGKHLVHKGALEVGANPTSGWILAGPHIAVEVARKSREFDFLAVLRIEPQ